MGTASESSASSEVTRDLLAGCREGDRDAQHRLYELTHRQVYRLLVRMVGAQDAADVTQQLFLKVFQKIGQFRGASRFETWLYRVAVHEALQFRRRKSQRRFCTLTVEPEISRTATHEERELLTTALARLDRPLCAALTLREVNGLAYREIAEVMKIPEGTVGSRLNRARQELRKHLVDLGWEP